MTYLTAAVSPSANPGPALYAAIEPTLLTAGFELVDTVVLGTRTYKVLKSPAASNSLGKDWYLNIHYLTVGTAVGMFSMRMFEHYDPVTKLCYRGPIPYLSNTNAPDAVYYSYAGNTGYALNSTGFHYSTAAFTWNLVTGTYLFWITATLDRVILAHGGSSSVMFAGLFLPNSQHVDTAGEALFPLVCGEIQPAQSYGIQNSATGAGVSITRVPKVTSFEDIGSSFWREIVYVRGAESMYFSSGNIGSSGSPITGENSIVSFPLVLGGGQLGGSWVGELDGIAQASTTTSVQVGDKVVIGAETWVIVGKPGSTYAILIKEI